MNLNLRAAQLAQQMISDCQALRIASFSGADSALVVDCGIEVAGGLEAGRLLAEVCLAGLGQVRLVPDRASPTNLAVSVVTDHPVAACMASQYAGWQITGEKYFAMGSGPMRAAAAKEALFARIGFTEQSADAVGVLESRKLPPAHVCRQLAEQCGVSAEHLILFVAPTASLAGTLQVVARSVETSLHKLFELGFDLSRVVSGWGAAPLPPVAENDLAAIGRTNDAILYGGQVTLLVRGDDASLQAIGPQVPSNSSNDYGQPFSTIFERYNRDFYKIDPHLFSPAVITLSNVDTGHSFRFGQTNPRVLADSFGLGTLEE